MVYDCSFYFKRATFQRSSDDSIDCKLLPVTSLEKGVGFALLRASGSKTLCQNLDDEFPESTEYR
jgi:hypothetical protein